MRRLRPGTRIGSRGGRFGLTAARADRRPLFTGQPAVARRSLLKGSLAALALSPLLQSCGDPGLAFSGVERIPAPDDPDPLGPQRQAQDHRVRADPRGRHHAAHLQLRRLPLPAGAQELREEVRRRHPPLDVQRRRRGADQDRDREPRLRPLLPELRLDRPVDHRRPAAAAQPGLHDQHPQPVEGIPRPVVRPRWSVHAALHDLLHRHRLAQRPGARGGRRSREPLRRPLGHAVQGRHGGPRRLAHRDGHGAAAQRPRHEQHRRGRHRRGPRAAPRAGRHDGPAGDDRPVHRHPRGQVRAEPDVVGRRDQHAVLPAGGHVGRHPALLVPRGRARRGRQRPGRLPRAGQEPRGGPCLHQRPDGRGHRRDQLRVHRLPAAAHRVHARVPRRERVRPREPRADAW